MIRAGLLGLVLSALAGPTGAQTVDCFRAWLWAVSVVGEADLMGTVAQDGDWCVATDVLARVSGPSGPDWHIDRLRVRGSALGWVVDGTTPPEGLEIVFDGLGVVFRTGDERMDWLLAVQGRRNAIAGQMSFAWDPDSKVLRLEALDIDYPGENALQGSATVIGVDLSSLGSMQMSLASFAVTDAEVRVTTHGLFEVAPLMTLGLILLPPEGDMDAAAERIRADALALISDLPGASFSAASKAALAALMAELPNPSGDLALSLRAEPGLGPTRVAGYALTGVPETMAEAAPLFQGVVLDVDWTHSDAP